MSVVAWGEDLASSALARVPIGKIARVLSGGTPTPEPDNWGGEIPWATPVDLNAANGHQLMSTERTLTPRGLRGGSTLAPAGSVLLSTRAPIGYAALSGISTSFNQGCKAIVPGPRVHGSYLLRLVEAGRDELIALGQGSTFQELSTGALRAYAVPLPDLPRQIAVAKFLDRETGEIDAFIRDQEELIGLLQERRDSSWQAAVDGLASMSAEMPLRRVINSIVDGPFGSSLTTSHYSSEGARVIRLGNIGINRFKLDDEAYIPFAYFRELIAHAVQPGDVIVAGLGDEQMPLGRAAVVPDLGPALVKADCFRVRPSRTITSEYLAWILSAPQTRARMQLLARGSTRQRLNTAVVRNVHIPVPSLVVQERTVSNWRDELREIDGALQDALQAKALSRERRSALIAAAVTGQIDVREHVGV